MAFQWERGYSTAWRVRRVDPGTWLPGEVLGGVDSVTVKRGTGDSSPLLESGEMSVTGEFEEGWYRIEALATQGGQGVVGTVATLLFSQDGSQWSRGSWGGPATGRSVLAPASELMVAPGSYAPKGADGAAWCASLLAGAIPSPVRAEGSFELSSHVVLDLGSSVLDAAWQVLDAAGWCMQIAGDGSVTVMARPAEPALEIDERSKGLLMPELGRSLPVGDVPNVVRLYRGGESAEAVNDDPASPTSTVARGRRIERVEEDPALVDGETLAACARRRLAELSGICEELDIEREYADGVLPYSAVRLGLARPEVRGDFMVMSQTVECAHGIKVGETLGRRANG